MGGSADSKLAVAEVEDALVLLIGVQHLHRGVADPDAAGIGRLAAALREEAGLVQLDSKAADSVLFGRLAGQHLCITAGDVAVKVKQFFGHGALLPLQGCRQEANLLVDLV